jgi:hypothetical protein
MNNSNGDALLARVTPGALVTVRRRDGGQSTGRAEQGPTGAWRARTGPLFSEPITAATIIRVQS